MDHVLLLAGSGEARQLAGAIAGAGERRLTVSYVLPPRVARDLPGETRIGGFGGDAGFRAYLAAEGVSHVVNATHPFAAQITDRTAAICGALGVPQVRVLRPAWVADVGDDWTHVRNINGLEGVIPAGSQVFVAAGRESLSAFEGGQSRVWCRQLDAPQDPYPYPNGDWVVGRPPFSVDAERALFARLGVTHLVVKNAGGAASRTKLDAARLLGIRVVLIARPEQPDCDRVETVEGALAWLERH